MKRTIARWTSWWIRLFVLAVFLVPGSGCRSGSHG
jgi:hypothetical protein